MTVKAIHLLRHAKSSWSEPGLADHDRPLSGRGRRAAGVVARYLADANIMPDLVLCSTALRAHQTLDLILPAIKPPKIIIDRELYDAGERLLLDYIRDLPDAVEAVLLIGHNPGLQLLAMTLAQPGSKTALPEQDGKFPTAALASFQFAGSWPTLQPHRAALTAFITPRDIGPDEHR